MRRWLRGFRIGIAAGVFLLFAAAFLGPVIPAAGLAAGLPQTQAGPAFYRLLATGGLGAALTVALVVAVTLLAGRLYCAAWCPLGVLQDGVRFVARRMPWLRRWQDRPPSVAWFRHRRVIRWTGLAATAGAAGAGFGALAAMLEPYSAFGRMASDLAGPLVRLVQEALAAGLETLDIYALSESQTPWPSAMAIGVSGAFFLLVALLAALGGRSYCTTVCPVGTVLGLLARAAPVRVRIDPAACTQCGLCARRCRAGSIQTEGTTVRPDPSTCVACMDCLVACPAGAVRYGMQRLTAGRAPASADRRELLAAGSATALALLARPVRLAAGERPAESDLGPVSPPGAGSRARFLELCTACQLCVTACPSHVLRPALFEYDAAGVLRPRLSFEDGFCEYDCNRCTTVCPTGALRRLGLAEKQRTQLGVACLHKTRCIVYCRGEECGACAEVCPTHAVYTQEQNGLLCPEMAPGSCIGCGACEYACPEYPKAIEVQASAIHGRAAEPHVPEATPQSPSPPVAPPAREPPADFPF